MPVPPVALACRFTTKTEARRPRSRRPAPTRADNTFGRYYAILMYSAGVRLVLYISILCYDLVRTQEPAASLATDSPRLCASRGHSSGRGGRGPPGRPRTRPTPPYPPCSPRPSPGLASRRGREARPQSRTWGTSWKSPCSPPKVGGRAPEGYPAPVGSPTPDAPGDRGADGAER